MPRTSETLLPLASGTPLSRNLTEPSRPGDGATVAAKVTKSPPVEAFGVAFKVVVVATAFARGTDAVSEVEPAASWASMVNAKLPPVLLAVNVGGAATPSSVEITVAVLRLPGKVA